jgi:hypothetical protein
MTLPDTRVQVGLLLTLLTLVGCAATGPTPARFEEKKALPAPTEPREIALTRLVSKLPVGTRIGRTSEGWLCLPQGLMTWRVGVDEGVTGEVIGILRDELQKAGYRIPEPPKSLFEEPSDGQAELLLAGAIKAVTLNVCSGPQGRSSEGSVEIEWQLYERRTRSVVLTSTTGGTAKSSRGGRDAYFDSAVAALRSLLAQEAFVQAVGSAVRGAHPVDTSVALRPLR